jgi:hypothetical protein
VVRNAQELFDFIISKGSAAIDEFISEHKPENLILDFKAKSDSDGNKPLNTNDKSNFAKALSGFANSSGGVLVWGVGEEKVDGIRVAYVRKPISNLTRFVQNLEALLPEAVVPSVEGVRIEPIKISDKDDKGYVVVLIPESPKPPHRAEFKLHQYFKRSGDSFLAMEHFEIEDMFGRRARPDLVFEVAYETIDIKQDLHKYKLVITIKNEGRGLAKYYGFDFQFPRLALERAESAGLGHAISKVERIRVSNENNNLILLSYRSKRSDPPLFPGEVVKILPSNYYGGRVNYCVDNKVFTAFNDRKLKLTIYCDNAPTKDMWIPFSKLNKF